MHFLYWENLYQTYISSISTYAHISPLPQLEVIKHLPAQHWHTPILLLVTSTSLGDFPLHVVGMKMPLFLLSLVGFNHREPCQSSKSAS